MSRKSNTVHVNQVYVYDFTFFGLPDQEIPQLDDFITLIQPLFKRWVFQLEESPTTKKLHYQGRGSLFKKKRQDEVCKLVNGSALHGMDFSESSNNSLCHDVFYTLKYDTRFAGPWDDRTYTPPPYIAKQYRDIILRPWQQTVLDSRLTFQDRIVDCIVDTRGAIGKSTVASLGRLKYGALDLPPISDHKELLQIVCDVLMSKKKRDPGLVFIDCPRSLDQRKMGPYFIAIEQIKKGFVCDTRYHYKEWDFDSPRVWVFINHDITLRYLSRDRWRFWQVCPLTNKLKKYEPVEPDF